jgi:hypothetical protein
MTLIVAHGPIAKEAKSVPLEKAVPEFPVSHPDWCSLKACNTYLDHDGTGAYVVHAAMFNGRANYDAALSQREVVDATGRTMELDEAYITVRRDGVTELHLPARQARTAGEELGGHVEFMAVVALGVLDQAS